MSKELIEIHEIIAEMPESDRWRVGLYADTLREFLDKGGQHAHVAFTLVGQELSDKIEEEQGG